MKKCELEKVNELFEKENNSFDAQSVDENGDELLF